MAQLSRPFQVGLAAVALLAAVWLLLLQGHGSNASSSGSSASQAAPATHPASAPSAPQSATSPGSSSHIYHGAAPGVEGLTKDIARAHGAVEDSQRNAATLERKSAEASSTANQSDGASQTSSSSTAAAAGAPKVSTTKVSTATASAGTSAKPASHAVSASRQHQVEAELADGKVVLILFWNPSGADDRAVHSAVGQLRGRSARLHIAIQEADAGQVAEFGSITRGVQVYGTPTLLVVNGRGQVQDLTGLQDAFTIDQAISEARAS